jgi:methyl coenzyme M reductase subunit C
MKEKVDEIVKKVQSDPKILDNFKKNPTKTVEGIIGVDLPEDQINSIVEAVKTKIDLTNLESSIKGLFG